MNSSNDSPRISDNNSNSNGNNSNNTIWYEFVHYYLWLLQSTKKSEITYKYQCPKLCILKECKLNYIYITVKSEHPGPREHTCKRHFLWKKETVASQEVSVKN